MTGQIIWVSEQSSNDSEAGPVHIHVKANLSDECGIVFTVGDRTWIGESTIGNPRPTNAEVLEEGAVVEVWFTFVAESCPGQSHAEAVNRIE